MDILYYLSVFILGYLLPFAGISKLFEKAGETGWKAYVPILNYLSWAKIVGRPSWHLVWLCIPIVNIFTLAAMAIELNRSFGKYGFWDNVLAIAAPFAWFPYLGFVKKDELSYKGPAHQQRKEYKAAYKMAVKNKDQAAIRKLEKERPFPKKTFVREWADSILFAVFAAHFIRLFLIEAYTIPTPSMEGSLLVGDFLFVSKLHYGSRLPMTPLSFPLLHNVMPLTGGECYSKWPSWDYNRAPALQKVNRYDPVVFNYPEGDTIIKGVDYSSDYHNILKGTPRAQREATRQQVLKRFKNRIVTRPVDKRDHYIKRCVGLPGDSIEVRANRLFVNGQEPDIIPGVQYRYELVPQDNKSINMSYVDDNYALSIPSGPGKASNFRNISPLVVEQMLQDPQLAPILKEIRPVVGAPGYNRGIFPYNGELFPWNNHNYGPIWIPKKGETVNLSMDNIDLYKRVITAYEGHDLLIRNGQIIIDGQTTNSYTFEMDYYWMMGDNRDDSADSRSWGFVPATHIVGKPLFVWMSIGPKGIRFDRILKNAAQ